jgi:L-aspartate oxidase
MSTKVTSNHHPDILILGSGIAGLTFAIKCAEANPKAGILILTKAAEGKESNTRYAQGGVAAVWDKNSDSLQKHVADTLSTGDGLCRENIVRTVVESGPERLKEIIGWGANFDTELAREGGHSESRILHHKDITGAEIMRALTEKAKQFSNITLLDSYFALDFITQHHLGHQVTRVTSGVECYGCYALNVKTGRIETILSRLTVCASGGIGHVYKTTTNPTVATGDGIAMIYRAKGRVEDMEFVQFHPTAFFETVSLPHRGRVGVGAGLEDVNCISEQECPPPNLPPVGGGTGNNAFLISEAVRGAGAELKTPDGKPFMHKYDTRGSLAPRDIVARAIDAEMKIHGSDCMYLDCRAIGESTFRSHFPTIYDYCLSRGIDPMKAMIPVAPACHYLCGGIAVDAHGQTSISRLLAIGECASTGLHGANRLASNSLLECIVFAHEAFLTAQTLLPGVTLQQGVPDWNAAGTADPREMVLITQARRELQDVMSTYVGIVRSNLRLQRAMDRLFLLYKETEELYRTTTLSPQLAEVRNLITIGYLITRSALQRRESRGLHYNTDHPAKLSFVQHSVL